MRTLKVIFLLATCLVLLAARPASAQSAEESAARSAQSAGQYRQAFTHHLAAWNQALDAYDRGQSPAADQTLERIRLAIFLVVRKLDPPPAIPDGAIANLTYYLQAAPDADDATEGKKKIGGLQYLVEKDTAAKAAARTAADQQARATAQATSNLSGTWISSAGNRFQYVVTTNGSQIELLWTAVDWGEGWRKALSLSRFHGTVQGLQISGQSEVENERNVSSPGDGTVVSGTFTGTISPDGRTITIQYPVRGYTAQLTLTR